MTITRPLKYFLEKAKQRMRKRLFLDGTILKQIMHMIHDDQETPEIMSGEG